VEVVPADGYTDGAPEVAREEIEVHRPPVPPLTQEREGPLFGPLGNDVDDTA